MAVTVLMAVAVAMTVVVAVLMAVAVLMVVAVVLDANVSEVRFASFVVGVIVHGKEVRDRMQKHVAKQRPYRKA